MRSVPIPEDVDFGRIDLSIRVPAYKQIITIVLGLIRDGRLQPGDLFPSGTQLCEHYNRSYYTIRHAVEQLQVRGVLIAEQGRETRVNPDYVPPPVQIELPLPA